MPEIIQTSPAPQPTGLSGLRKRLQEELDYLCLPPADWLQRASDDPVLDVAIIGGGMSGLTAAAALRFVGVHHVQIFDRSPAGYEGPWVTHARMQTLRSPKELTGPALGIPALTFRAWYEAQYGRTGWDSLERIERVQWQDYLNWYRAALDLPVQNDHHVAGIRGAQLADGSQGAAFTVTHAGVSTTRYARHVVLATGMDGLGGPEIPPLLATIPRTYWQHTSESIAFSAWQGQRIGVWGGGDSALDAAATAAESGAATVDVFIRGADFSRINYWKAFTHPGHAHGFATLTPEQRQPLLEFLKAQRVPPSQDTVRRVAKWPNIRIHFESPVRGLVVADDHAIAVETPHDTYTVDHLVVATGYTINLALRPELTHLAPHIRFWSDQKPALKAGFALHALPDLGPDYALRERIPGTLPVLERVHLFTGAALLSHGKLTGDIPGISQGAQRLTQGIVARLYAADQAQQLEQLKAYDLHEVDGTEWQRNRVHHSTKEPA